MAAQSPEYFGLGDLLSAEGVLSTLADLELAFREDDGTGQPAGSDVGGMTVSLSESHAPTLSQIDDVGGGTRITVTSEGTSNTNTSGGNADIAFLILRYDTGSGMKRLGVAEHTNGPYTVADGQELTVDTSTDFEWGHYAAADDTLPPDTDPTTGGWENTAFLEIINDLFDTLDGSSISANGQTYDEKVLRYVFSSNTKEVTNQGDVLDFSINTSADPARLEIDGNAQVDIDSGFNDTLEEINVYIRDSSDGTEKLVFQDDSLSKSVEGPAELSIDSFPVNI